MSSARQPHDIKIKLLMIGDSGVGKSCLVLRFSNNEFTSSFITTIGIDFKIKTMEIEGKRVKLQLWDTAGQERFRTITNAYYRGAHGVLLVYDVTDEHSFFNIRQWMNNISEHANESISRMIIGNKCDMVSDRCVSTEKGMALAKEYGVPFYETSAKNDINVEKVFIDMAKQVIKAKFSDDELETNNKRKGSGLKIGDRDQGGKNCACQLL
eukprot:CAMPEP_0201564904 /NCGR_PEP_ID=MMETSP0190_2-20130828/3609_1 /ASSEMBLY_ACC=CAM_ASM_000263 /TAXON_ID=37353 /ORGANISM="Rosalina sp." /LENGTH=210 /DNA_ID=CAMNT_0047981715 /DNA_START=125 /DNA_END=757 /DNA_ORIENTATION=+